MKRELFAALLLAASCGSKGDPFAGAGGAGVDAGSGGGATAGGAGTGGAVSGTGGAGTGGAVSGTGGGATGGSGGGGTAPPSAGARRPARLIVVGDSLMACSNVGGKTGANCSIRKLYDYVKATYAPSLSYENEAVGGAVTADVPARQLPLIKAGPGHALVVAYVGGNDLSKYIFVTDAAAQTGFGADLPKVVAAWGEVAAFFGDKAKFPDGVTLLMNNQFNPFDDCTAAPYFLSAKKIELLGMFNAELKGVAMRAGATIVDQYMPFLGHGHHYNVRTCPHYVQEAASWMDDLIHPNATGHNSLFERWKQAVDGLYRSGS
jgi:lysophospholipase L1-like esterase